MHTTQPTWTQPHTGSPIHWYTPAEWGRPSHEIVARQDGRYDLSRYIYPVGYREHVGTYDVIAAATYDAINDAAEATARIFSEAGR